MQVNEWLRSVKKELQSIVSARLDALILLEDCAGKDRAWLLAHPEYELDDRMVKNLNLQVKKRAKHVPLAYIRGKSEFYGRTFKVTPATLQPRSETETIIELLKKLKGNELRNVGRIHIADIGTGSGCLAITARLELPDSPVFATEINNDALKVAKQNADILRAQVNFYLGDLLEPLRQIEPFPKPLIILANLPYVPNDHVINEAAMQEPKVAIFGGPDGLDLYRKMFAQIAELESKPRYIFTESLPPQHTALTEIAARSGYDQLQAEDFIQVFCLEGAW